MRIRKGLLDVARQVNCENCGERPDNEISLIVIHCISLPAGHFGSGYVEDFFCNRLTLAEHPDFAELGEYRVSSHLFIRRTGEIIQFVPFHARAWHAGESSHRGRSNCNDYSLGIELEGTDQGHYSDQQYAMLGEICEIVLSEWSLQADAIVGHSDISPGRKTDPGPGFDWQRLRRAVK